MRKSDAFPSTYLSQADLQQPTVLTIDAVRYEEIRGEHGAEDKPVVFFREKGAKKWIINSGCWDVIAAAHGDDSDNWGGKQVELYADPNVMFGGKRTGGVRVRVPSGMTTKTESLYLKLDQALDLLAAVGINKDAFKNMQTLRGFSDYKPSRDTAYVRELIANGQAGDAQEPEAESDGVPF